jgi:DNA-binding response OmpR family regulator
VQLSNKEFSLLHKLASDPTRVFLKHDLLREVWGFQVLVATRTLDAHASRLRRKLRGTSRQFVITVRGVGYRLTEEL